MSKRFTKLARLNIRKLGSGTLHEHGLTFTRLPNGDGLYSVNIMVDGQRIHRVIGRESEGVTRTQAEDFIEKVRREAREGRLSLTKGRKVSLRFREAASRYLERLSEEGGNDLQMKRSRLTLHLVPFFGSTPLAKICTSDIERYKVQRSSERSLRGGDRVSAKSRLEAAMPGALAKPASPGSINRELAVLSHLLNKAIEWGWIDHRPAKINRLTEDSGRIIYLTVDESRRLLNCAKSDDKAQLYPFVLIGLRTSMRMTEILSIRREHVNLERLMIYVPKAKAGAREQPITGDLAEFLAGYMSTVDSHTPWLFPSARSKTGHTVDISKPYRRAVAAAGLDSTLFVRHTLRHTAITHLVQAGVDLPTVQRISGHKTMAMVARYAHANGAHIQLAMDRLQNRLNTPQEVAESAEFPPHDYTKTTPDDPELLDETLQPLEILVGRGGFEPPTNGLKVRCSTS